MNLTNPKKHATARNRRAVSTGWVVSAVTMAASLVACGGGDAPAHDPAPSDGIAQSDARSELAMSKPLSGAPVASKKQPSLDGVSVPTLSWGSCGTEYPDRQCATVLVPLDYNQPRGATIRLALARYPARNVAQRIGTVFVNPGGPGGSAVDLAGSAFGKELHDLLGGRFDVVGIDPRGVAYSEPLLCFESEQARDAFFAKSASVQIPVTRKDDRAYFDAARKLTTQCFSRSQKAIGQLSTADVARDMELMRRAVGDEKLTYIGFSYGSHIGNTYANLFPDKVRALVIDGVLNPVLWTEGMQIMSDRTAVQDVVREFMRLCDKAGPSSCALAGPAGAQARYDRLIAALRRGPIVLADGGQVQYGDAVDLVYDGMYVPERWAGADGLAATLAALLERVDGVHGAGQSTLNMQSLREALRAVPRKTVVNRDTGNLPQIPYIGFGESALGNHCSDAEYPSDFATWQSIGAYADAGSIYGASAWWPNVPCSNWPVSKDRYVGPWSTTTSTPVLVVGNYFDPATDYAGAVASNQLLRNSSLLSYAGWGHTAFGRSACITEDTVRYLVNRALPPRGKVCAANPSPFLQPKSLAADSAKASTDTSDASSKPMLLSPEAQAMIGKPQGGLNSRPWGALGR